MSLIKGNHAGLGGAGAPGGALGSFFSHTLDQSLRFNGGDTPRLTRTWGAAATDDTTWTVSMWVKRASQDGGNWHTLFAEESEAWTVCAFYNDTLYIQINAGGAGHYIQTNRLFRDFSSWYHIVVAFDEDNGTATHRLRLYINGTEETSFATDQRGSISSSSNSNWNTNGKSCAIGARSASSNSLNFDGYMAEFHNIDGQQLTPSSFGETKGGVWIPKAYSGSHGDNGFYLPFDDSSAIGDDESANTNDWTVTNLAAHDVVPDSPTTNFATMNPLMVGGANTQVHASAAYAEGNLKVLAGGYSTSTIGGGFSSMAIPSDKKIYVEVCETNSTEFGAGVLIQNHVQNSTQLVGNGSVAYYNRSVYRNGVETDYGSSAGAGGLGVARLAAGDVLGIAIDGATGKVWFHRNGTYFKSPSTNNSGTTGNPSAGSNEIGTVTNTIAINPSGNLFFFLTGNSSTDNLFINFGQDSTFAGNKSAGSETDANGEGLFQYAVPTDYVCLHSGNMSDPAIGPTQSSQADDHFNTVLYTGNGSTQNITGVGFQPDWTWIKNRAATDAHALTDSVRGVTKEIQTNALSAESTNADGLTAFGADGFSLGDDDIYNTNTETYVSWNWKGGGSASTNTDGSGIDSSVSANTDAGISILTYTGTGNTSHTIGHGLGKTPAFVMSKSRDSGSGAFSYWFIKWNGQTSNNNLLLNFTDAQTNIAVNYAGGGWSDFDSSNTTTIVPRIGYTGSSVDSVNKSGEDYVAYVFAQVEGFSAIGSFIGNGNDNGIFVYTGFRPAWLWIKRIDAANDWHMMDDHRNPFNLMDGLLFANGTYAETSDAAYGRDFLSNGFKIRGSEPYVNASGGTFVYMAFANSPFKFANAF
jgi:hypothetical protein